MNELTYSCFRRFTLGDASFFLKFFQLVIEFSSDIIFEILALEDVDIFFEKLLKLVGLTITENHDVLECIACLSRIENQVYEHRQLDIQVLIVCVIVETLKEC